MATKRIGRLSEIYLSLNINQDSSLTDVEKLFDLKFHIQGEAKTALSILQMSAANYTTAWTTLESRYDLCRLLV